MLYALLLEDQGNGLVDPLEQREQIDLELGTPLNAAERRDHLAATWGLGTDARRQEAAYTELNVPTFGED